MLDSVKIARRQSEIRQALAELVAKDAADRRRNPIDGRPRRRVSDERNPLPRPR